MAASFVAMLRRGARAIIFCGPHRFRLRPQTTGKQHFSNSSAARGHPHRAGARHSDRRALSFARYLELAKSSPKPSRRFSPESPRRFVRTMPSIDEHLDGLALPPSAAAETGRTNNDGLTVEGADEDALQPRQ